MSSLPAQNQPVPESSALKRKLVDDDVESFAACKRQNTGFNSNLVIVDPDGDLKMAFETGVLQVSRKALSLASPVFLAMFKKDSGFKESVNQSMDQHAIQTVSFPDDSLDLMTIIVHIIHLQFEKVPNTLLFEQFYQMAIYCDKYDLRRCLGPYPDIWSKTHLEAYSIAACKEWLLISPIFSYNWVFKATTKYLILSTKSRADGRLLTSQDEDISVFLSESLMEWITSSRTAAMFVVQDLYWQERKKLLASEKMRLPILTDPREEVSLGAVKDMIAISGTIEDVCGALIFKFGDHRPCVIGKRLAAEAQKVLEGTHGLDLE